MRDTVTTAAIVCILLALGACSTSQRGPISAESQPAPIGTQPAGEQPSQNQQPASEQPSQNPQSATDQPTADPRIAHDHRAGHDQPPTANQRAAENQAGKNLTFGQTFTYHDGLAISVSKPSEFEPSEWTIGYTEGQRAVAFTVTIANGSPRSFDPTLYLDSVSSAGTESAAIFDSDHDTGASPTAPVLPGESVTFTIGYSIADPTDITMEIEPSWDYAKIVFTN